MTDCVVDSCSVVEAGAVVELSAALTEDITAELNDSVAETVVLLDAPLGTEDVLDGVNDDKSIVVDCPSPVVIIIELSVVEITSELVIPLLKMLLSMESMDDVESRLVRVVCCCGVVSCCVVDCSVLGCAEFSCGVVLSSVVGTASVED